jgi:hypothetical protein
LDKIKFEKRKKRVYFFTGRELRKVVEWRKFSLHISVFEAKALLRRFFPGLFAFHHSFQAAGFQNSHVIEILLPKALSTQQKTQHATYMIISLLFIVLGSFAMHS